MWRHSRYTIETGYKKPVYLRHGVGRKCYVGDHGHAFIAYAVSSVCVCLNPSWRSDGESCTNPG